MTEGLFILSWHNGQEGLDRVITESKMLVRVRINSLNTIATRNLLHQKINDRDDYFLNLLRIVIGFCLEGYPYVNPSLYLYWRSLVFRMCFVYINVLLLLFLIKRSLCPVRLVNRGTKRLILLIRLPTTYW